MLVRWIVLQSMTECQWDELSVLLDAGTLARASRLGVSHDRGAFIAAHALTRGTLSRYASLAPSEWRFCSGPHGKPEIAAEVDSPPLRFNLSHTRGLVAVAVGMRHSLGVDIELVDRDRLGLDLALSTFAPAECEHLLRLPVAEQTVAAFRFWTLKEAYLKATGLGLSVPLKHFAFTLAGPSITFTHRMADDPARWHFHQLQPTPEHILALAVQHDDPAVLCIDARATTVEELLDR